VQFEFLWSDVGAVVTVASISMQWRIISDFVDFVAILRNSDFVVVSVSRWSIFGVTVEGA